jgi:PAB-dependent poly(A)-specific ribonuclease subunit 2
LGIGANNIIVCLGCKAVTEKENMIHVVDMIYLRKVCLYILAWLTLSIIIDFQPFPNKLPPQAAFADILPASLIRKMTHKATCQTCEHFSTFPSRRSILSADLPILVVNAAYITLTM